MASIDNRVVQMTFDNSKFEQNAKTTQETLRKLDESLAFKNGARGLQEVEAASGRLNFGPLQGAVSGISQQFDALGVIGVTALMKITSSAIDAGAALIKSLTIEPIATGLNEYETKINAIQTILTNTASKGTTLEDVNQALGVLNEYADKTIYNFAEMARNIGTFTAAGIELQPATDAIKGIANLAAGSGSTAQQASTAMYQLSQALAEGRVSLQTWNSVVNAGMGGELFQHELVRQALANGKLTKEAADSILEGQVAFRAAITQKAGGGGAMLELGTEDLMGAFLKFAEDPALVKAATRVRTFTMLIDTMQESVQSGWAQSWEHIIGDMDEAAEFLTEINDAFGMIVGAQADARNELLRGWKVLGGRDDLIQAFRNIGAAIMSIVKPIGEAFSAVFAPMTAFDLANITDQFRRFTEGLILSESTMANLKSTFQGVFSIFDIIGKVIGFVIDVLRTLVGTVLPGVGDGFLGLTARVGEFFTGLNEAIESSEIFQKGLEKIQEFIRNASVRIPEYFHAAISGIEGFTGISFQGINDKLYAIRMEIQNGIESGNLLSSGWSRVADTLDSVGERIQKVWDGIKKIFSEVSKFLKPFIQPIVNFVTGAASQISSAFQNMFSTGDFSPILKAIETGVFGALVLALRKFVGSLTGITDEVGGFVEGLGKILGGATTILNDFSASIKADALKKVASAILTLAAALFILALIDSDKMAKSLTAITALFIELVASMSTLQKTGVIGATGGISLAGTMVGFSVAMLILSGALAKLSSIDHDSIMTSILALGMIMGELVLFSKAMRGFSGVSGLGSFVVLGAALLVITQAIKQLAALNQDTEKAWAAIGQVGLILAELALFSKLAGSFRFLSGLGFMAVTTSLLILLKALEPISIMNTDQLRQGLAGVGLILAELAGFALIAGNAKNMISVGIGMNAIASSLLILNEVLSRLGNQSWDVLKQGLLGMGLALAELGVALRFFPKDVITKGAGLVIVGGALLILGKALEIIGSVPVEVLAIGLGALAVALTVLGVAGKLLGPVAPSLLMVAGAVTLLGAGLGLAGAGLLAFSAGVGALAVVGAGGLAGFSAAIRAFLDTIPYAMRKIGEGLTELAKVVIDNAPVLSQAFITLIHEGLKSVGVIIPDLVRTLFEILNEVMDSLQTQGLPLAEKLFDFIISIFGLLEEKVPEIVSAVLSLLTTIFGEVTSQLGTFGIDTTNMLLNSIESLAPVFLAFSAAGLLAKQAMKGAVAVGVVLGSIVATLFLLNMLNPQETLDLINGLSQIILVLSAACLALSLVPVSGAVSAVVALDVFVANLIILLAAMGGLRQIPGLEWLIEEGALFMEKLGSAIGRFVGAIVGGVAVGFTSQLPKVATNMSEFAKNLEPFLESISKVKQSHIDAALGIVSLMLAFTAAELLDSITSWFTGGSNIVEFGKELEELAPHLVRFAEDVSALGDTDISGAVETAKSIMELANMVPNSGGVAGWWFGENSIAAFGKELESFAPSLKSFINETAGITRSSAYGPVEATKLIMEMASMVPNSGGITGWWFGENNLSSFALELEGFGRSIAEFANETAGITSGSVKGSVDAATLIMEMASLVPNQGGVAGWWFGENSLVLFAEQLDPFGKALGIFSSSSADIKPEAITTAVAATKELVVLAESIPNKGGVASFFYGDNDFTTFGYTLDILGKALVSFSTNATQLDISAMSSAVEQVGLVIEMASKLKDLEGINANDFRVLLSGLGKAGVDGFVAAFSNSQESVRTSVLSMINYAKLAIEESLMPFGAAGKNLIDLGFTKGVQQAIPKASDILGSFFNTIISTPKAKEVPLMNAVNLLITNGIVTPFTNSAKQVTDAMNNILNELQTIIRKSYEKFRQAGNQIALGLKQGLIDKAKEIAAAAAKIVQDALAAANAAAAVASPSKETYWTGQMMALGLLNALTDSKTAVSSTARQLAESALTVLNNSFSDSPQLVITPVLDMEEMTKQTDFLKTSLADSSGAFALASKAMSLPSSISSDQLNQNGSGLLGGFNFVQNNYSPRALTRAEIYRQTNNLLSTVKGAVLAT